MYQFKNFSWDGEYEMPEKATVIAYPMFGKDVFSDSVMKERLKPEVYAALQSAVMNGKSLEFQTAGEVADAMMKWAIENGATHFTHWFQPMTGTTAEKRDAFLQPDKLDQKPITAFSAKALIRGEADGSSFPSGGLRATFEARGYTTWDCTSPAFIKRNPDGSACLCIPTAFCSFSGEALDEKTPLLRSMEALNRQAVRVLRILGDKETVRVTPTVGAEQEYFLVDRHAFLKRKDLVYTGRTLFGSAPSKSQELADQYYAATPEKVMSFMSELNDSLWRMGVPCKTEHNEAAPSQYELAQLFVSANLAVDHNQLVMEMMRRIAERHGMTCLLHEKPFRNVNGSGKHNNWSMSTDSGRNLLRQTRKNEDGRFFSTFLLAVISAVDDFAPMMRMSCASLGNECRLGGNEAPPQIMSVFLGEELQEKLAHFVSSGNIDPAHANVLNIGVSTKADIKRDNSDRNRTSPMAFTGDKFEFRMVGAVQSLGLPNTVLNTIVAEELCRIADRLEKADNFDEEWLRIAGELYDKHKRVIFNGNNYDSAWVAEARKRGLPNIDNTVDAIKVFLAKQTRDVFKKHAVFSKEELQARCEIALQNYTKLGLIEAVTMVKIAKQMIIPAAAEYSGMLGETVARCQQVSIEAPTQTSMLREINRKMNECRLAVEALDSAISKLPDAEDASERAIRFRDKVQPKMETLRQTVDAMECIIGKKYWPLPSYGEMLFRIAE